MLERRVNNIGEFIAVVSDAVDRAEAKGWKELDMEKGGNCVALKIYFGSHKYRFNANNKIESVREFLKDFDEHGLTVLYITKASGAKIDSVNRIGNPRNGLYLYRNE